MKMTTSLFKEIEDSVLAARSNIMDAMKCSVTIYDKENDKKIRKIMWDLLSALSSAGQAIGAEQPGSARYYLHLLKNGDEL